MLFARRRNLRAGLGPRPAGVVERVQRTRETIRRRMRKPCWNRHVEIGTRDEPCNYVIGIKNRVDAEINVSRRRRDEDERR